MATGTSSWTVDLTYDAPHVALKSKAMSKPKIALVAKSKQQMKPRPPSHPSLAQQMEEDPEERIRLTAALLHRRGIKRPPPAHLLKEQTELQWMQEGRDAALELLNTRWMASQDTRAQSRLADAVEAFGSFRDISRRGITALSAGAFLTAPLTRTPPKRSGTSGTKHGDRPRSPGVYALTWGTAACHTRKDIQTYFESVPMSPQALRQIA